nr:MAG: RNA-dependent RNA polymerase [Riboviria sp.]
MASQNTPAPSPAPQGPQNINPIISAGPLDDGDNTMRYYMPMPDICLRPKLPSLTGSFWLMGAGAVMHTMPSNMVLEIMTKWALTKSHKHLVSACMHAAGQVCRKVAFFVGDFALGMPSFTGSLVLGYFAENLQAKGNALLAEAAFKADPSMIRFARACSAIFGAMNVLAKPVIVLGIVWAGYAIARHLIEPPPYEAPPGCYPMGGPLIEITQEEAPKKEMVFACPAGLARAVQERTLLCERDPVLMQKVKSIASRWCDNAGLQGNQRYAAMCGAMAAALTVPINEQLVLQLSQTHSVQKQYSRLAQYLTGVKHRNDPWWTKYFLIRH